MEIEERKLKGIYAITATPFTDNRGYMVRLFDDEIFRSRNLNTHWAQESRSHTMKKNTIRGLHVSLPPSLEGKTITAVRGEVLWVVVDIRRDSKTFGEWDSVVLSGKLNNTLYAEKGFAHGCRSLCDNCDLLLRADIPYSDKHGTGILWNDQYLKIDWQLNDEKPLVSEKDRNYPVFAEFKKTFGGV